VLDSSVPLPMLASEWDVTATIRYCFGMLIAIDSGVRVLYVVCVLLDLGVGGSLITEQTSFKQE
jgi:hypothetical protein